MFSSLLIGLYVVCDRIFNCSFVLCVIWNFLVVIRIFCSSGYRLCRVVKWLEIVLFVIRPCKHFILNNKKVAELKKFTYYDKIAKDIFSFK